LLSIFFNGDIPQKQTFQTFLNFNPLKFERSPEAPAHHQQDNHGFMLQSLPSSDRQSFYEHAISRYINSAKSPEPFDVSVEVFTGDGTLLQKWNYIKCDVRVYSISFEDVFLNIAFSGEFGSEIRDKTVFGCVGLNVDFEKKENQLLESPLKQSQFVPSEDERLQSFVVTFSNGEIPSPISFSSFPKFFPITTDSASFPKYLIPLVAPLPLSETEDFRVIIAEYVIGSKPEFILVSDPSKDKEILYQFVSRYVNPGKAPQLFDVTIDHVMGNSNILQTWTYTSCVVKDYSTYRMESLLSDLFKGGFGFEIRENFVFSCNGLFVDPTIREPPEELRENYQPFEFNDEEIAQIIVVSMESTEISPKQVSTSFAKFEPIKNEDLSIFIADSPTSSKILLLESLPTEDKEWFYDYVSRFTNPGKTPEPVRITIEIISGDGTILQTWDYKDCSLADYITYYEEILVKRKFIEKYAPEIRERSIFYCNGFSFDGTSKKSQSFEDVKYIDFIPTEEERVQTYVTRISGGELTDTQNVLSFMKFTPTKELSEGPSSHQKYVYGFELESLPNKDNYAAYEFISRYVNPQKPPEPFDMSTDLVTGNGNIIQTWNYQKCDLDRLEIFMIDNLFIMKIHGGSNAEIRERFAFKCDGHNLDFNLRDGGQEISNQMIIPSDNDRAVSFFIQLSDGEFESTKTFQRIKKVTTGYQPSSSILFTSENLPEKSLDEKYDFLKRYVNPGKAPEPVNLDLDILAGDGTKLYTLKYINCVAQGFATYLEDNVLLLKFKPGFQFEIREKDVIKCDGLKAFVPHTDNLKSNKSPETPLEQSKQGLLPFEAQCKEGFEKLIKPEHSMILCVFPDSVDDLLARGMQKVPDLSSPELIWPDYDDRAEKFVVHMQGTEISPPQIIHTVSKHVPFTDDKTQNPVSVFGAKPKFYLESLPSLDKSWFYEFVSKYINSGKTPEPFDVTIEVLTGDGTLLETIGYVDCEVTNYEIFLDESLLTYKYHERWQSEIRDKTIFECLGKKVNWT